jgi:hypothetical protein
MKGVRIDPVPWGWNLMKTEGKVKFGNCYNP